MFRSIHRRTFLTGAAALAVTAGAPAARAATASRIGTAFTLPGDTVYPEGITADPHSGFVYVGSYATGAVYRAAPGRRTAEVFLAAGADGRTTANGLKADRSGRLWVIDSTTGVDVYDQRDRALLARFEVPGDGPRLVNDLVITPDGSAYLTDSIRAVIYRVTPADLARAGTGTRARTRGDRATLTVAYDLSGAVAPHASGAYTLNGIVADAAGRYLLVVDMTAGDLFRVDLATGAVRQVALHGGDLVNGDGLELAHGRLWAARNADNTITRWHLDRDADSARLEHRLTDQALQIPTTLVRSRGGLLVVRSQFDKGGPLGAGVPVTPFSVARVTGI